MADMDTTGKLSNYANIGTFILTAVVIVFMVYQIYHPSGRRPAPEVRQQQPITTEQPVSQESGTRWVMPSALALALIIAAMLQVVAARQRKTGASSPTTIPRLGRRPEKTEPKLKIHRAVYAARLPYEVPVTDILQNGPQDAMAITVDYNLGRLIPEDPAAGVTKTLEVEYSYGNDRICRVARPESTTQGETCRLVLPEDTDAIRLGEIYADTVYAWLRDHIHTSGTFSSVSVSQAIRLPRDAVMRGLDLLRHRYHVVENPMPDQDLWTYRAGVSPLVPKYKIVVMA